ncbi:MAG: GNAT family N-acetyltransferase [Streptosporangiales bacterium]|nr:GNAT family N-acetyltransferase [Streptosporangiales bacterium]
MLPRASGGRSVAFPAMGGEITVRALTPDDWEQTRAVRLSALADAPDAFVTTLAEARGQAEAQWRAMLTPERGVRALAEYDGLPAGVVGAFDHGGVGEIIWMWVAPDHRGRGVGDALVAFCVDWCGRQALDCVLWVVDGNDAAQRLYERCGFVPTGSRQPVPGNGARMEFQMAYRPAGS